ncbi:hypothetical protein PC129_g19976 [Phytophthora cactorum]|uniref:Uncharacterized protein n=1 Tax=Phytophthora cactorum TaxID=29920 RepID=A0A8T1HAN2_9STRA|nr:hypothetical protein PC117_g22829 [Phytophthora cactorum]KAG3209006.1 hypothetical protein PC129_g19976 [Phytophthora cactorum]
MLNVLISKWMITQGLLYTLCTSDTFKDVIHVATEDPSFPRPNAVEVGLRQNRCEGEEKK